MPPRRPSRCERTGPFSPTSPGRRGRNYGPEPAAARRQPGRRTTAPSRRWQASRGTPPGHSCSPGARTACRVGACPPPPACGCLSSPRPAAPRNCSLVRDASRSAPSPSEDCGWLALDRGGRRRWCSMATCGSRRQQAVGA
ncbi:CGNR zinc finger domain-containing protein [Streptomyces sp. NPDC002205]|uniref:CGNR zinc finger domain-containing protein n=1 Tax=Streptomyces sp. NPDC002205 TaxID=3154411 RepID=UPI00333119D9